MPVVQHFARYGAQRPGTNRYASGGFAYGAFRGFGAGTTTPTNVAVVAPGADYAKVAAAGGLIATGVAAAATGNSDAAIAAMATARAMAGGPMPDLAAAQGLGRTLERARAQLPPTASQKAVEARAAALEKGAKGGFMGAGIPWAGKTPSEKTTTVVVGGGAAAGGAWMLGLL